MAGLQRRQRPPLRRLGDAPACALAAVGADRSQRLRLQGAQTDARSPDRRLEPRQTLGAQTDARSPDRRRWRQARADAGKRSGPGLDHQVLRSIEIEAAFAERPGGLRGALGRLRRVLGSPSRSALAAFAERSVAFAERPVAFAERSTAFLNRRSALSPVAG
jgi:hypothetical protein